MTDRDRQSLLDIITSAQLATEYLHATDRDAFMCDRALQDAIVRRLEIVGEAARRLSNQACEELDSIRWTQIIGMRNIMIHQYDRVDLRFVWETATQFLPKRAQTLQIYLSKN